MTATCPHCGGDLDAGSGTPRSLEQHRRYFALMKAVYHHWPETHRAQFDNETECRKWLQMLAGHREIAASFTLTNIDKAEAMMLAGGIIMGLTYAVPVIRGDALVIYKPKSIAFGKLDHKAFCKLNDEIDAVIKAEIGMDADVLLKEHEAAA